MLFGFTPLDFFGCCVVFLIAILIEDWQKGRM